jgi:hypothetical protein
MCVYTGLCSHSWRPKCGFIQTAAYTLVSQNLICDARMNSKRDTLTCTMSTKTFRYMFDECSICVMLRKTLEMIIIINEHRRKILHLQPGTISNYGWLAL